MPVESLDEVERKTLNLIDNGVPKARIVLIEEHPRYPGYLNVEPLDPSARGMFYQLYTEWMSRHLILNELHLARRFTERLADDGYHPLWTPSTAAIQADIDRWNRPLDIEGYTLRPFQTFSLNRALERARQGTDAPGRFYFWNWSAGAGKSFCSGAAAKALFDSGDLDLVIACTFSKLKENLRRTFVYPAGLDAVVNDGTKSKRRKGYEAGHQVYVMNYEKLWHDEESLAALVAGRRVLWVLDEALALDTPLLTPFGWTTVGEIQTGDQVLGTSGWTTVTGKTSVRTSAQCLRVVFDDNSSLVASADHRWSVCDRNGTITSVLTTEEMSRRIDEHKLFPRKVSAVRVPVAAAAEFPEAELPIDPWILGYWLGNGERQKPMIIIGEHDAVAITAEITRRNHILSGAGKLIRGHRRWYLSSPDGKLRFAMTALNLLNNKHIPECYFWASRRQRMELLKGLMDSDGHASKKNGMVAFTQKPGPLMDGVERLVRSLGFRATRREFSSSGFDTNTQAHQLMWRITSKESVFTNPRKANRLPEEATYPQTKRVIAVEQVAPVPVQCLEVDAENHLFCAGEALTVTHNCHKLITDNGQNKARAALDRMTRTGDATVWPMSATVVGGNPLRFRDVFSLDGHPARNPLSTRADFVARYADRVRDIPIRSKNGRHFSFTTYDWNLAELQEVRHRVGDRTMAVRKTDPGVREQFKGIETLPTTVQATPETRELLDLITDRARVAHRRGEGLAPHYLMARIACINPEALRHSSSPEAAGLLADRPDLLDAAHSAKIEVLNGLLEGIREAQDKAVVFCHWTELGLLPLARHLTVPHVLHYGTGQSAAESQAAQDRFKADPDITAFCSSDAGTHGLNLQEARYVVNVDPTYSYDDLAQRNARIDRADSHLDGLTAYVLITEDSVEERVWEVCQERRQLAAAVQGTQEELSYGIENRQRDENANLAWLLFGEDQ